MVGYPIECSTGLVDLATLVPGIADSLSNKRYIEGKTDCSGMLNQVQVALQSKCDGYKAPTRRDSRVVAEEFKDAGKLVVIKNPEKEAHRIKPGAIMFFGIDGKDYTKTDSSILFVHRKGIKHVSFIVDVERKNGKVVKYRMFHGQNPRVRSGTTTHVVASNRRAGRPLYGNWDQPWVAVASLAE